MSGNKRVEGKEEMIGRSVTEELRRVLVCDSQGSSLVLIIPC